MTLSVTISGEPVSLRMAIPTNTHDTLDQRQTLALEVRDDSGALHIPYGAPVLVTDSYAGELFKGFVQDSIEENLPPNTTNSIAVTCFDEHYLADKRVAQKEYTNAYAGDIAVDLLATYLSQEGVTAAYAQRSDSTQADFQVGALTGVVAAANVGDGNLELAPAGSAITQTFTTTGNFTGGTRTRVDAGASGQAANQVNLSAYSVIKLMGTCVSVPTVSGATSTLGNSYAYWEIYNDGVTVIASGDTLRYDVWVSSTSPAIQAAVDFVCTDGTTMRDFSSQGIHDQNFIHAHPGSDLNGYANDQWYARTIDLTLLAGKTISYVTIVFEGDNAGDYTAYFRNIKIYSSAPAVKTTIWDSSVSPYQASLLSVGQNYLVNDNGYAGVSASSVTAYDQTGTWQSAAFSIDAPKIVRDSRISWTTILPAGLTAASLASGVIAPDVPAGTTLTISSSFDDTGTWQPDTFNAGVPNLSPGFSVAGRNASLKADFAITGTTPEVSPILDSLQLTVSSSWKQSKSDSRTICRQHGDFNTGNYTGTAWYAAPNGANSTLFPSGDNGVALNGCWEGWDRTDGAILNTTTYSSLSNNAYTNYRQLNLFANGTGSDVRLKQNNAPSLADFTAQVSIAVREHTDLENGCGLVYRTTNWNNTNNTFAYTAMLVFNAGHGATPQTPNTATLQLGRGVNSNTSPAYTGFGTSGGNVLLPFVPAINTYYTLKVVVSGSTHKVYLDDILYITGTDSTFSAAGGVALRYYDNMGVGGTGIFENFGMVAALSGTWDNGSGIALASTLGANTIGNTLLQWDADVPPGTTLLAQTSINGGSTWQTATNGAAIPNLPVGTSASGKSVKLKFTLTSTYPGVTVILKAWAIWLTVQTNASGSRVSPALNLSPVGRAGSTLVSWNGSVPAGTSLDVDTGLDGKAWTNVGSGPSGGVPVAGIATQPDAVDDTFGANTSSFYTSTFQTGGSVATWDFSTATPAASSITASGGATACLLYSPLVWADVDLLADMDTSDAGGLVWRFVDSNTFYDLTVCDASSPTPGVVTLCKVTSGARGTLASGSVTWTRGTPHRIRAVMLGAAITVSFDGVQVLTASDTFPLGAGLSGLRSDTVSGASAARFYQFRVAAQGDSTQGTLVWTRTRLASTDPTATAQLSDLTTSVRSPDIGTGAFIPSTAYSVLNGSQNTIAQDFDDLARQSNYSWKIKDRTFSFRARNSVPAPFIITAADMLIGYGPVTVQRSGALFRTKPWVQGGTDVLPKTQPPIETDGIAQTWTLQYPVDSLTSATIGAISYSFGIKGVDSGRDLYYQVGSNVVSQDPSEPPFPARQVLSIDYNAQVNVVATAFNTGVIAAQAAIENTSGLIEVTETASGLNSPAAQQLAASRATVYGTTPVTVTFPTARTGLAVGQWASLFLPQHQLLDWQGLITDVQVRWRIDNGVPDRGHSDATPYCIVTATDGYILNSWATTLSGLAR